MAKIFSFIMPSVGSSFFQWIALLSASGGVEKKSLLKMLHLSIVTLGISPFIIFEKLMFESQVRNAWLQSPVFILGHWRSGTSYLQRLMASNDNLGYFPTTHALLNSEFSLSSQALVKMLFRSQYEKILAAPAEEEFAVANASPYSFYHSRYFPRKAQQLFENYVTFESASESEKAAWTRSYIRVLKRISLISKNKRLVIKNPVNTGRIRELLEIFPDAKFIHIYRNPYKVLMSARNMFLKYNSQFGLQSVTEERLEENVYLFYQRMMQQFLAQSKLIPQKNFIELKYEDFVGNELENLIDIHRKFDLPFFEYNKERADQLINQLKKKYMPKKYNLSRQTLGKIERYAEFALDHWRYSFPKDIAILDD